MCSLGVDVVVGGTLGHVEENPVFLTRITVAVNRRETDFVLAGIERGEREVTSMGCSLGDDSVVVVECFLSDDEEDEEEGEKGAK